ncbi:MULTISPECIES: sensor histidine kinase [Chryseobacterium]|jgi:signal transduction histidine kinase|uniref:histidine kinase n=1 Tax=Chryseobacterium indoltheticum TaxID=254 RepID=A0A381JR98_9FLAO|nr:MULTISPECIES: HAMP domain-containing sensor histidine kinase [Chryseobacterium]AZA62231.1 sensor histidine kinase [Chryseobacterium indoltheticum]AZA75723.1 sensor histidine kinase [Chryseobacterium indoltheticum]MDF2833302.1 sensor histidine kinase [Chryseobacterium indoltheticum]MDQ8143510.1 HAMP domain-containing sensor histidine kinase [Chryseobacterium sp. CFS15]SIQ48836.1 HAMP domain-containing protein [Chryseobacterium indoltheticum]
MAFNKYKGYSLRNRVFFGFLLICLLSVAASSLVPYFVLRNNALQQSKIDMQEKTNAVMAYFDYALSRSSVQTEDLRKVLGNKIFEIADINQHDIIIYDLKGNYLLSNKDLNLVDRKKVPLDIVNKILSKETRYDVRGYDASKDAVYTSSYLVLKNNMWEPIGIIYIPLYHNESAYMEVLHKYVVYILLIDLVIIAFSIWLSWVTSNNLAKNITKFSDMITRITLFENEMRPIKYYKNDELNALARAYNRMILQIQDQKERLRFKASEEAWREMAKQVAHEVKNPLTPMKLTIQNFERKFDPQDPNVTERVKQMSKTMVDQIDVIATVASAFSEFAKLPEKNNEVINLNNEIEDILRVFNDDQIFVHANKSNIMITIDRVFLSRIITNLVTNAKQAKSDDRDLLVNVDIEQHQRRVMISVQDNGVGIPEDMYERIFEPNFTSKNSGMGLGLSMVRKMIEDYKGEISVKSKVGKGSTFIITLPTNL